MNAEVNNNEKAANDERAEPSKTVAEQFPLMVTNPSYVLQILAKNTVQQALPDKSVAKRPPVCELQPDHIEITSQDMLAFAEQIASGMVSGRQTLTFG